jgi:hypothetical protein
MRTVIGLALFASASVCFAAASEPELLFYLSGDNGFTADYAAGNPEPNFLANVKIIPDGARGKGFECANTQLMAYWAPGNIYAQRGTLAFSWRSRYPVGPTPFPIFRVGYADHSSWDMMWLRIDYNGEGGFDAFVTDINLSRIRVSYEMPVFPKPNEWVHLAFSWDETAGIRFYVNGCVGAEEGSEGRSVCRPRSVRPALPDHQPVASGQRVQLYPRRRSTRFASTTACCRTPTWRRCPKVLHPGRFRR